MGIDPLFEIDNVECKHKSYYFCKQTTIINTNIS